MVIRRHFDEADEGHKRVITGLSVYLIMTSRRNNSINKQWSSKDYIFENIISFRYIGSNE